MTDKPLPAIYDAMTPLERRDVRRQYIRLQGGFCCHCGGSLDADAIGAAAKAKINRRLFPKNFFAFPVHLHHSHKTGLTIGAVHNRCNAYLWQYKGE